MEPAVTPFAVVAVFCSFLLVVYGPFSMKFRLTVQPKPREHKSIVPSHLLSDPAFSPDPHLNPYFADQQLAWAPPQGHPVLKNKNKGPVAHFALRNDIIASAGFDFQLLQPPNSPVSILGGSGTQEPSSFPFLSTLKSSAASDSPVSTAIAPSAPIAPATASTSLVTRSTPVAKPAVSTVSTVPPQPPAAKVAKKRRMPFLTRRKSQAAPPNPPNAPPSSTSNNVTRPLPPRMVTEPVTAAAPVKRPVFPPRSATIGTDTPRSTGASSLSAASKRHGSNSRLNDLDRIDELDETNPWGISLHHGGPYEAAVQAIRRGGPGPSGFDPNTTSVNEFHTQYGQPYVPPQAPPGVSLNLSPGQILPRNFGEQRPSHPRPRDTSALPPRMQQAHPQPHPALSRSQSHASSSQTSLIPPRHMNRTKAPPDGQSEPLRYRRQSQPVLPSPLPFPLSFPILILNCIQSSDMILIQILLFPVVNPKLTNNRR
ncbi:hypothetical protein BJ912DRAFT_337677 [Pholiota molesta]|nr:hypothetical protein BJ912DRAFT_337677 [Pholiota molesta]